MRQSRDHAQDAKGWDMGDSRSLSGSWSHSSVPDPPSVDAEIARGVNMKVKMSSVAWPVLMPEALFSDHP
jgi:hypothetical protein